MSDNHVQKKEKERKTNIKLSNNIACQKFYSTMGIEGRLVDYRTQQVKVNWEKVAIIKKKQAIKEDFITQIKTFIFLKSNVAITK